MTLYEIEKFIDSPEFLKLTAQEREDWYETYATKIVNIKKMDVFDRINDLAKSQVELYRCSKIPVEEMKL